VSLTTVVWYDEPSWWSALSTVIVGSVITSTEILCYCGLYCTERQRLSLSFCLFSLSSLFCGVVYKHKPNFCVPWHRCLMSAPTAVTADTTTTTATATACAQ
jgi:hypothetical protein